MRNSLSYSSTSATARIASPQYAGRSAELKPLTRYTAKYVLIVSDFDPDTVRISYRAWELTTPIQIDRLKMPESLRWAVVVEVELRHVVNASELTVAGFLKPLSTLGAVTVPTTLPVFSATVSSENAKDGIFTAVGRSLKMALRTHPNAVIESIRTNPRYSMESELEYGSMVTC